MTGTTRYTFGDSPASLTLLLTRVLSFRREGFITRVTTEHGVAGRFTLHTLHVTAPVHPSRRERGL